MFFIIFYILSLFFLSNNLFSDYVVLRNESVDKDLHCFNKTFLNSIQYINNEVNKTIKDCTNKKPIYITHSSLNKGIFTINKPKQMNSVKFLKILKKVFRKFKINPNIAKDEVVNIASELNLDGNLSASFNIDQLKTIQSSSKNFFFDKKLEYLFKFKDLINWQFLIPTTGLYIASKFKSLPAIPLSWNFTLTDLAPSKGEGIKIVVIDTGEAAFKIKDKKNYLKNKNLNFKFEIDFPYNLVREKKQHIFTKLINSIYKNCDTKKINIDKLFTKLPILIKNYLKTKNLSLFENFFIKNCEDLFLNKKTVLNTKGQKLLKSLLYGKNGIIQNYNLCFLEKPFQKEAILEFLPAIKVQNKLNYAAHGTQVVGLIGARKIKNINFNGLAENANILMIKAFDAAGETTKSTLIEALNMALLLKADIVNMSFKITDKFSLSNKLDSEIKSIIDKFDYVVAASGNNGASNLSYPAAFESVAFSVGAFDKNYNIPSFSQYKLNLGPYFVEPGFNILSTALIPNQLNNTIYSFFSGTSAAVPICTAFLALVLAEFSSLFSKAQILKVIFSGSIKLKSNKDWNEKVLLGAIDKRSCLLCFQVLKAIKLNLDLNYLLKDFDSLILQIYKYIYEDCDNISKQYNIPKIRENFVEFILKTKNLKIENKNSLTTLNFTIQSILEKIKNEDIKKNECFSVFPKKVRRKILAKINYINS